MSATADLATECWPWMGNIATTSWSMIDEWSSELTLAVQRMLTQVSRTDFSLFSWCVLTARVLLAGFSRVSLLQCATKILQTERFLFRIKLHVTLVASGPQITDIFSIT